MRVIRPTVTKVQPTQPTTEPVKTTQPTENVEEPKK